MDSAVLEVLIVGALVVAGILDHKKRLRRLQKQAELDLAIENATDDDERMRLLGQKTRRRLREQNLEDLEPPAV